MTPEELERAKEGHVRLDALIEENRLGHLGKINPQMQAQIAELFETARLHIKQTARLQSLAAQLEGMRIANIERLKSDQPLVYNEQAFFALSKEFEELGKQEW